jgi:DNA-directed RNA polymerase subunit RPC12/RpoP
MSKSRRQLALLALAVVVAAAAVGYHLMRSGGRIEQPRVYKLNGACLACQQDVNTTYTADEFLPLACPHCGERAVYAWVVCEDCGTRFVPEPVPSRDGSPPQQPSMLICPNCGSTRTCVWAPEYHEGMVERVHELPEWPVK